MSSYGPDVSPERKSALRKAREERRKARQPYPEHRLEGKAYQKKYNELFRVQGGKCAICHVGLGERFIYTRERFCRYEKNPSGRIARNSSGDGTPAIVMKFELDHSHKTGIIRELLCYQCN